MLSSLRFLTFLAPLISFSSLSEAQIFADFKTNLGDFTCQLDHDEAPVTVANFVGLAEGSRPWIRAATGEIVTGTPFYDGLTFHRVIKDFMIQSGSQNGLGTDGPGYTFIDERNGLNHNQKFVISMANSGISTNGSQFFINVEPSPHLNGVHTVFGKVISGSDVVTTISKVTVSDASKPVDPVVLNSVRIRKVGAAALALPLEPLNLPVIAPLTGTLSVERAVAAKITFAPPLEHATIVDAWQSPDLTTWKKLGTVYHGKDEVGAPPDFLDDALLRSSYYRVNGAIYRGVSMPEDTGGRTINLKWDSDTGPQFVNVAIGADGNSGTLTYSGRIEPVPLNSIRYDPSAIRATYYFFPQPQIDFPVIAAIIGFGGATDTVEFGRCTVYQSSSAGYTIVAEGTFTLSK